MRISRSAKKLFSLYIGPNDLWLTINESAVLSLLLLHVFPRRGRVAGEGLGHAFEQTSMKYAEHEDELMM